MVKEAVGEGATDALVEENEYEADLDALVREAVGIATAIAYDQSPGFHLSEIVPELGKGIIFYGQPVGLEDSLVKHGGGKPLDLVGGMEEDFHEAHHAGVLDLDTRYAAGTGGKRQSEAFKQGEIDVNIEQGCLKTGKAIIDCMEGFFHLSELVEGLFEMEVSKVVA